MSATTYYRNLVPGQFQIGNLIMGYGTNIKIDNWDVKPYDINNQDYQVSRADEMRFGWDSLKPTTIEIQAQVPHNRLLPGYEYVNPNFWKDMPTVSDIQREWRFDEGRNIWNKMKPLYVCSKLDSIPKIVWGRPGQFGMTAMDEYNQGEIVKCLMEFRRGDTYAYSVFENLIALNRNNLVGQVMSQVGQGPTWLRMQLEGPITNPQITLSNLLNQNQDVTVSLNYSIPAGQIVEVSAYPWARRVITLDNPPVVLSALLGGVSPYLDKLRFDFNTVVGIQLEGTDMTDQSALAVYWRDAYQVI